MFYQALAFLSGICVLLFSPWPSGHGGLALLALPLAVVALYARAGRLALLLAGIGWAALHAQQRLAVQLPPALENAPVLVRGVVVGLPQGDPATRLRFRLQIHACRVGGQWQPLELPVRLSWYRAAASPLPGEHWQLQVRLKRPHGFANPAGFDYERWLFAEGLRATGYVRRSAFNRYLDERDFAPIAHLRHSLVSRLQDLSPPPAQSGLLQALAVGDRAAIGDTQWRVLATTGTSHLLAISGLHVGLVAGLTFLLIRRGWPLLGLASRCAAPRAAAVAAMLVALLYALLAGFQVPAQRALIMVCVWMTAILMTARVRPWQVFAAALWLILLLDPLAVLTAGFWLSFAAVAWILFLTAGRVGRRTATGRFVALQCGLLAGLTPLLWLWFQQASLVAPLANLVAIPLVGTLVVPLVLVAAVVLLPVPAAGEALLRLAGWLLDLLWYYLEALGSLPGGIWNAPPPDPAGYLLSLPGLLVLLAPLRRELWPPALALLAPLLLAQPARPAAGDVWMTVLDVGQGLAVVVETRRHLLVYDTGPGYAGGFNTGAAVVAPFLRSRGHRSIDRLLVSHADTDHRGGAVFLHAQFAVAGVDSGEPSRLGIAGARQCLRGQRWTWDRVRFEYLAPASPGSGNNASCVLSITAADGRVLLLPGDIEAAVEQRLLADGDTKLAASVLVAPHHGSLTSSTPSFVARVRPSLVVFASGYRNRFGFPREAVVARYRAAGSRLLNTADSGAVEVRVEAGRPLAVAARRAQAPRIWRESAP